MNLNQVTEPTTDLARTIEFYQRLELPLGVLDSCLHIIKLDVHPAVGRQGIGGRLLNHSLQVAEARSFPAVLLTTFEHLPWNAPFYARHGFEIVSEKKLGPGLLGVLSRERDSGVKRRVAMRLNKCDSPREGLGTLW